ncbi:hypothetical protein BFJ69_g2278 [Fusarium oxysporum]|uniref:Uncharacterized protein n=1 Tax=Fusarium oxysporum TaxID=5507 RepID=A0A420NUT3_FUSOX|nr:hypothetical protein BFJ69_g2278 [Fusarium oxysporum]
MQHSFSTTLIEHSGVSVNIWDEGGLTALHAAIHCSGPTACPHIIDVLLRHSADINALSKAVQHILHTVAQSGGTVEYLTRLAAELLQHGADANVGGAGANALDGNGASALHLAATHGVHAGAIISGLLRHGADPRTRCRDGRCVLHYLAKFTGPPDVAKQLRNLGLDPNAPDEHGQTPLLHATVAGLVKMVRLLCESGIGVNTPIFDDHKTAFFCAVRLRTVDAVQVLLQYGADLHHRGHSGRTVLHYHEAAYKAMSNGSADAARINKLLIACGANVNAKRGCCRQGHGMSVLDAGGITRAQGEFALFLMSNGALSFR